MPEVDFIANELYPVPRIKITLANIYAQILNFCVRATKWYNQIRQGFFKKMMAAVTKTWPLEFRDIKLSIEMYVRQLREQAAIASQAELRDMHLKLVDVHNLLSGINPTRGKCSQKF